MDAAHKAFRRREMANITRRRMVQGASIIGLSYALGGCLSSRSIARSGDLLTGIDNLRLPSEAEAQEWHRIKDELGPTITGSPSWRRFLEFTEAKLREYGCIDVSRSPWTYTRMETSEWPDDSGWSLTSGGRRLRVSNYGANCGITGPAGVTAPLVVWDAQTQPDIAGKIVIFRAVPNAEVREAFGNSDYEYLTPFESYPVPGRPVPQTLDGTGNISPVVWDEMTQSARFIPTALGGNAAGIIFATGMNEAATAGLYTFPVPQHYDIPSVYLDRQNGDQVIADAGLGKDATIRIDGRRVDSEAYQLVAYLPGKDYGTDRDRQIHLRTHTDGPSISQDNGAFGLLGVVNYISYVPQAERPRTLFLELDCRHFMPGAERAFPNQDYFEKFPNARDRVVAMVAMEHLGQIEYAFDGEAIRPTGRVPQTWLWATENQGMIDYAFRAAGENRLPGAVIRTPGRPGRNGRSQGPWYGMAGASRYLGLPGFGTMGDLGAYWQTSSRVDRFDANLFVRQVATFAQLTGFLMTTDLAALQAPPVARP